MNVTPKLVLARLSLHRRARLARHLGLPRSSPRAASLLTSGCLAGQVGDDKDVAGAAQSTTSDTDDHFNVPAGTVVTADLKSGTTMSLDGTTNGIPITVTCTRFTASAKTSTTGAQHDLAVPDVQRVHRQPHRQRYDPDARTNGDWRLAEVDTPADDGQPEPNATGDKMKIGLPKAGATERSSLVSGRTLTFAPNAVAP